MTDYIGNVVFADDTGKVVRSDDIGNVVTTRQVIMETLLEVNYAVYSENYLEDSWKWSVAMLCDWNHHFL